MDDGSLLPVNEDASDGARLVPAKSGTVTPTSLTYAQALDEALCSGWIDSQAGKRDDTTYFQRFTPRRTRSIWSQRNVGLVEALIAQGRMRSRGQAEIERARLDGRWERAYPGSATVEMPDDVTDRDGTVRGAGLGPAVRPSAADHRGRTRAPRAPRGGHDPKGCTTP